MHQQSKYVPAVAFFQGQHSSSWFFFPPANIHWQHFTSLHINFIFQNLSYQHLCSRFVQTSFAVSVWLWKYIWSNMFTNHSVFWIIKLENGTNRRECEWMSVLQKSDFSHDVSRELEMPSPLTKLIDFHSNVVKYWNEHTSYAAMRHSSNTLLYATSNQTVHYQQACTTYVAQIVGLCIGCLIKPNVVL
jgi:hypothetical protein